MVPPSTSVRNLANAVTVARIALVPLVVVALAVNTEGWRWFAAALFALAASTDRLDGYIARPDGGIDWLFTDADYGYREFYDAIDTVVMGRKTFESIGRPLPGRTTVIVSRDANYRVEGCLTAHSIDAAIQACGDDPEVFFVGGADLYSQVLARAVKWHSEHRVLLNGHKTVIFK